MALVTDGRFSGATRGAAIGHISPEACNGGPIAFVREGDTIAIDIPNFRLDVDISQEELERRKAQTVHRRQKELKGLSRPVCPPGVIG